MYIWVYICNIYIHVYMHIHNLTKICLYIYLSIQQVQRKYQWAQCTQTDCLHKKIVPIRWKLTCLPDSSLICILLLIFSSVPVQLNKYDLFLLRQSPDQDLGFLLFLTSQVSCYNDYPFYLLYLHSFSISYLPWVLEYTHISAVLKITVCS